MNLHQVTRSAGASRWRRIKSDLTSELTEASATSAVISIVAGVMMLYLFIGQVLPPAS